LTKLVIQLGGLKKERIERVKDLSMFISQNICTSFLKAAFVLILTICSLLSHAGELDDAYSAFNSGKYDQAFPIILKAAQKNNPRAQGTVARMYGNGWGVSKDEKEAYFWASKGALQEDAISQAVIGYMNLNGLAGFQKNPTEAIKWYLKAAHQENVQAMKQLADIYWSLDEKKQSIYWREKLFDGGVYSSAKDLAAIYQYDKSDPSHNQKAIDWLQKGAAKGDADSMLRLAWGYEEGDYGIQVDKLTALKWYEMAAKNNSAKGYYGAAYLYLHDKTVPRNADKGIAYFKRSAELGSDDALYQLATLYLTGDSGVKENHDEAYKIIKKLKAQDSYLAYDLESFIYEFGIDRPKNSQKAMLLQLKSVQAQRVVPDNLGVLNTLGLDSFDERPENSKLLQLPLSYALAWKRLDLSPWQDNPYEKNKKAIYDKYAKKLNKSDLQYSESLSFEDLTRKSLEYIEKRKDEIGPIEPRDLVDEGWYQFIGKRGMVNEPLAQYLTEEGLRLAIRLDDKFVIDAARNNLGVILAGSANKYVRNNRLALVHLMDGRGSEYGPDNLLSDFYLGHINLSKKEVLDLSERYKKLNGKPHPTLALPPLPEGIKGNPLLVPDFLIKIYNQPGMASEELASEIADTFEDAEVPHPDFKKAAEWHLKAGKFGDSEERYKRAQLIVDGKYVKDMPNFGGTLYDLFEVDLVTTRSGFLTNLQSAITPVPQTKKRDGKLKLYALVIGNSNYKDRPLKNSSNDSRAISAKLRTFGFNVTELENLDRRKFKEAVISFSEKAKDSDVTLLFYSGHGIQLGGINYLLPTDIDFNGSQDVVTYDGFSLNDIRNRNLPGATKLIFLDACRTNPFKSSVTRGAADEGLAPVNVSTGTIISYATRDGGVAYDAASGNNSPYTQSLLKHLDDDEDVEIMLRSVRDNVVKLTQNKQEPWKYGSLSGGKVIISKLAR
jgi:TPR repeat protein